MTNSKKTESTVAVQVRLERSLVKKLDEHVELAEKSQPGQRVTRSDIIRSAILAKLSGAGR